MLSALTNHAAHQLCRTTARLLTVAALATVTALAPRAEAQGIGVDPRVVVITATSRVGSLTLVNPGSDPIEVSIALAYAYAATDAAGRGVVTFPTSEQMRPQDRSAAGFIGVFPRRVVVPPGGMQAVRFRARPPADLPDGEYWARYIVTAKGGRISVATQDSADQGREGVQVGLELEMRTAFPLFFRKGRPIARIAIAGGRVARVGADSLDIEARLERTGDAAWVGTFHVRVEDAASGRVLATLARPHAVYFQTAPRYRLAVPPTSHAPLRVVFEFTTDRQDVPRDLQLRAAPVRADLVLPAGVADARLP